MNKNKNGSEQRGFRGYSTHRVFSGFRIPVSVQNLIMRDYATRYKLFFKLGVDEFDFPNCYVRLMSLLQELPTLEGIIMCSLFMLPEDKNLRQSIYDAFFKSGTRLHLVMEKIVVEDLKDVIKVEELIQISSTFSGCPTSIPKELLPSLSLTDSFCS
ncbi:TPA: sporadic carbohydrate cluster protein, TIGR04323 family [Candidatus Poribacteria bacterium]|nr:sporadic carbohydrate cluster protein, TIGR04323 family [Candidatus Poribacteria bacterium]